MHQTMQYVHCFASDLNDMSLDQTRNMIVVYISIDGW